MTILKTKNLTKIYGEGNSKVIAIKDINITVDQGEFIAIVGPSGSGKSTLLHLIGGVDNPTSGEIIFDGNDISNMSEKQLAVYRRRRIGFVFQSYNLIPVLNVEENISLPILLDNKSENEVRINELLKLLGIEDKRYSLPSELSGGQQQRVSIGRALAYKPNIILADEPTGNLDRKNGKDIIDLLKLSSKKYHQTLIIITHDLEIASQADRVIAIEDGKIVKDEVS
ncbi:MAG: ABC transporter ATP-binding protein [Clostridiales bacterium]